MSLSRDVERGFTLLEVVLVMLISGYLLSSMIVPFGANYQQQKRHATERTLHRVLDAVLGFSAIHGRLPCPAGEDTRGWERSECRGALATGFVPTATLGLRGPTTVSGHLLDSWHRPILYHVSDFDHPHRGTPGQPDFTSANEINSIGSRYLYSDIEICQQQTSSRCRRSALWANQVPLVLVSFGQNPSAVGDQSENQDNDSVFVHREVSTAEIDEFDDIVFWLSENTLIYELLRARVLP